MVKAARVPHHGCAACLASGLCIPRALEEQLEAMLGARAPEFDFQRFYEQADTERLRNRWVIDSVWQFIREAFKVEMALRGWSQPRPRYGHSGQSVVKQGTLGIVTPCPHAPSCPTTWACGKKQLAEREP